MPLFRWNFALRLNRQNKEHPRTHPNNMKWPVIVQFSMCSRQKHIPHAHSVIIIIIIKEQTKSDAPNQIQNCTTVCFIRSIRLRCARIYYVNPDRARYCPCTASLFVILETRLHANNTFHCVPSLILFAAVALKFIYNKKCSCGIRSGLSRHL